MDTNNLKHLLLVFILQIVCTEQTAYTASFTLTNAIPTDVWIQWSTGPSFTEVTPFYNIGPLSSGSHSYTINSPDIGENGWHFKLGMYGTGSTVSTQVSNIQTMAGVDSEETYSTTISLWYSTSASNCYIIAFNTYVNGWYDDGPTSSGCNDFYGLESNAYSFVYLFSCVNLTY